MCWVSIYEVSLLVKSRPSKQVKIQDREGRFDKRQVPQCWKTKNLLSFVRYVENSIYCKNLLVDLTKFLLRFTEFTFKIGRKSITLKIHFLMTMVKICKILLVNSTYCAFFMAKLMIAISIGWKLLILFCLY